MKAGSGIALIGIIIAIVCLLRAFAIEPANTADQIVKELRYLEAAIGILILGVGAATAFLEQLIDAPQGHTSKGNATAGSELVPAVGPNPTDRAIASKVRKVLLILLGIWLAVMAVGLSASLFGR